MKTIAVSFNDHEKFIEQGKATMSTRTMQFFSIGELIRLTFVNYNTGMRGYAGSICKVESLCMISGYDTDSEGLVIFEGSKV